LSCDAFFALFRKGSTTMDVRLRQLTTTNPPDRFPQAVRRVAIVANSFTPYRIYVHKRIVREVPEVELWTLMTHGNSYDRWQGLEPPAEIRPVMFGNGEPTIEQTKLKFALREWRKFGRIIRWLAEHDIEAVICQGFGDVGRLRMIRWCRRRGIPCFLTADCNICGDVRRGTKRLLKHLVVGQAIRWSSGVMPCGEYGRLLFERYGAARETTFMFPLISDLELFSNTPADVMRQVREQYGLDPQRRRILYCGRMMQVKRPDLTIAAFIALAGQRPDWDLVMMGEGPLREPIAASVPSHLADRVKWLGLVQDTAELASVFAQCDVLVLPSDKEPWGMVVIEAAAAGLALVMTDIVGASPELVADGENGRVFPPGNLAAFIAALRDVTHPHRIDVMKQGSQRVLARWLAVSDPVAGFREAMSSCGLIPRQPTPGPAAPGPEPRWHALLASKPMLTT
jgi:glycosyltransferase involved in cell wall biosynthesis